MSVVFNKVPLRKRQALVPESFPSFPTDQLNLKTMENKDKILDAVLQNEVADKDALDTEEPGADHVDSEETFVVQDAAQLPRKRQITPKKEFSLFDPHTYERSVKMEPDSPKMSKILEAAKTFDINTFDPAAFSEKLFENKTFDTAKSYDHDTNKMFDLETVANDDEQAGEEEMFEESAPDDRYYEPPPAFEETKPDVDDLTAKREIRFELKKLEYFNYKVPPVQENTPLSELKAILNDLRREIQFKSVVSEMEMMFVTMCNLIEFGGTRFLGLNLSGFAKHEVTYNKSKYETVFMEMSRRSVFSWSDNLPPEFKFLFMIATGVGVYVIKNPTRTRPAERVMKEPAAHLFQEDDDF